jgi:hypothetical protein
MSGTDRIIQIVRNWVSVNDMGEATIRIPTVTEFIPLPKPFTKRLQCYACGSTQAEQPEYKSAFTMPSAENIGELIEWVNWTCRDCGYQRTTAPVPVRTPPVPPPDSEHYD